MSNDDFIAWADKVRSGEIAAKLILSMQNETVKKSELPYEVFGAYPWVWVILFELGDVDSRIKYKIA